MTLNRRQLLLLVTPLILTLTPRQARADGSWSGVQTDDTGDADLRSADGRTAVHAVPGSYQWRQARDLAHERQLLERSAFSRFGSRED